MINELINEMVDAGVHYGHQTKKWNPRMKPFLMKDKGGIYIINLEKTIQQLDKAYNFSVMVNAVTNVLTRSVGIWKRGGEPVVFTRTDTWARLHQCGPACVHNN